MVVLDERGGGSAEQDYRGSGQRIHRQRVVEGWCDMDTGTLTWSLSSPRVKISASALI